MLIQINLQNALASLFPWALATQSDRNTMAMKIADAYDSYAHSAENSLGASLLTANLVTLKAELIISNIKNPLTQVDPAGEWAIAFTHYWLGPLGPAMFGGGDSVAAVTGTVVLAADLKILWDPSALPASFPLAANGLSGALDKFSHTVTTAKGPVK